MRRSESSIGRELLWLAFFLVLFFAVAGLFVRFAAGHHFNDRIAITLAAMFAALAMIGVRAWSMRRARRS